MLVVIVGTQCSGRRTVQDILSTQFRFKTVTCRDKELKQEPNVINFEERTEMLNFVTARWRENFVTVDLTDEEALEPFVKRPFCLVIYVDAPLLLRYTRHKQLIAAALDLPAFIALHDETNFGTGNLTYLRRLAKLEVVNGFQTVNGLEEHITQMNIINEDHLRPQWDSYFMMLASLAAQRSNCMKRRVGAILVRNKRIVATGYNGTPRGLLNCNEGGCSRCNGAAASGSALEECLCLHAEENALLEAGRDRIGEGSILYCNTCPCLRCSVKIVQVGVKAVIYNLSYKVDDASAEVFRQAGVELRRHEVPNPIIMSS